MFGFLAPSSCSSGDICAKHGALAELNFLKYRILIAKQKAPVKPEGQSASNYNLLVAVHVRTPGLNK